MKPNSPYFLLLYLLALSFSLIHAQIPEVSNVTVSQRTDGSKKIDVSYSLSHTSPCNVYVMVSANGGSSYNIFPTRANLSGAIGHGIHPGTERRFTWNAGAESYPLLGSAFKIRIEAIGEEEGENTLVYIPSGSFTNGSSQITLSSYYIDKYEVTQASYMNVMRYNPAHGFGVAPNNPVYNTTWFNAIEYCNRRSILEGYTPCYSYGTSGTDPDYWPLNWDQVSNNHLSIQCDWNANGYRLLTEMEWLYAAKGGSQTHGYPYSGSSNIGSVAWYNQNSLLVGPNHPDYGTHHVGTKNANELGLYDMTGNVYEWCWDIYGTLPYGPQTNPHGAINGTQRLLKGAGWKSDSYGCQLHIRCVGVGIYSGDGDVSFRVARRGDS